MSERDIIGAVVEYYEAKLATFGTTARGVDWKDEASQTKRFEQLIRGLGVEADGRFSILDFGCGYGALLTFLTRHGWRGTYTGYDRSPRMVAVASQLHEGAPGVHFTSDWNIVGEADYVVASGVFNVRLDAPDSDWHEHVIRTLTLLNGKATAGWAVNFLTAYADEDRKRSELCYASPTVIFDWCRRSASRWVSVLHDYELYEFTVAVSRRPR